MPLLAAAALAQPTGAPQDWSSRYVVHANPETRDEAAARGVVALERWKGKFRDARYARQVARKMRFTQATAAHPFSAQQLGWFKRFDRPRQAAGAEIHRDWSNVLGGVAGGGTAGMFPAKYSFDIFAEPSCANDFIVYTTSAPGVNGSGAFASRTGTFSNTNGAGDTITITRSGAPALVLTGSAGSNLGLNFQVGGGTTATAANLAAAINRNGGTAGVRATSSGASVTVIALSPGASPGVTLAESMSGFSWAGNSLTGGSGTAGQPTIVAFNQMYAGCGTTPASAVPDTFWSYNTGNNATARLSPVLSFDGSQVAFIQSSSGGVASLVLLKWSSTVSVGTVGEPAVPTSVTAANYRNCTAPCMTSIAFNGNPNNTNSSPFYDYIGDALYAGDNSGRLHRFTGVFAGTPAEQASGGFPATVSTGNMLSPPVYDGETGLVFIGSDTSANSGGRLHSVCATTGLSAVCAASGTVRTSGQLSAYNIQNGGANTTGVRDTPLLDSTAGRIYVFVESDPNSNCGGVNCKAIYQFRTDQSINNGLGSRVNIGRGEIGSRALMAGAFDDAYYSSANPASPSGALYACGSIPNGTDSKKPTLWKIPIANNTMGTPAVGPTLVTNNDIDASADCSPVTMVKNGTDEYLFVSVSALGNDTGCSGACIYMFNLTGKTWNTSATANAGLPAPGGTSGIVVDNISTATGASQVYYSTLASPGNAVQASQAELN
ncbi:MAG: hypothetical protein V4864_11625 [Pseudomonadota bacterium]